MNNITKYLERFNSLSVDKKKLRILVIKTLKDFGFEVTERDFKVKEGVIYFQISPILRTEIFLKKQKIINEIQKDQIGRIINEFK